MSDDEKPPVASAATPRKRGQRGKRPVPARSGELWARCPECRMPVKDAELFKHLLKCPGAEVRQAQWKAEQETAKPDAKAAEVKPDDGTPEAVKPDEAASDDVPPDTEAQTQ